MIMAAPTRVDQPHLLAEDEEAEQGRPDQGGIFDRRQLLRLGAGIGPGEEQQGDEGEQRRRR